MSDTNNNDMPEEVAAFRLIQHCSMQGEASYSDFQNRIQALKVIAQRLDAIKQLEIRLDEQDRYILSLETNLAELEALTNSDGKAAQDIMSLQ